MVRLLKTLLYNFEGFHVRSQYDPLQYPNIVNKTCECHQTFGITKKMGDSHYIK